MKRTWIRLFPIVVVAGWVLTGCQATRAGYESAPYRVVRSVGRFELRDYPALNVVETSMVAGIPDGSGGSFRRLFRFVTGANEDGLKIAMTTPVFMVREATNSVMAFVLPAELSSAGVPRPSDDALRVRAVPAGRFAVLRYAGRREAGREAEALARLQGWMKEENLGAGATPVYAYFDPPWTPPFLRRNEVMLRAEAGSGQENVIP